jgi:hypothetical protein
VTVNPLVAGRLDQPPDAWSGVWIAEDIELIGQGVRSGGRDGLPLLREGDGIVRNGKKILMTADNVKAIAAKYGIDINDVRIRIDKVRAGSGPGKELFGITTPDGVVTLTRDAFKDEEQLARTLAHERFHVEDIRSGMRVPTTRRELDEWERRAYEYEKQWWEALGFVEDGYDVGNDGGTA